MAGFGHRGPSGQGVGLQACITLGLGQRGQLPDSAVEALPVAAFVFKQGFKSGHPFVIRRLGAKGRIVGARHPLRKGLLLMGSLGSEVSGVDRAPIVFYVGLQYLR